VKKFINKITPQFVKDTIGCYRLHRLKSDIIRYLKNIPEDTIEKEQKEVLEYLLLNPVTTFPYDFNKSYIAKDIDVHTDEKSGLKYVLHEGKRLYFKRKWKENEIRTAYNALRIEQDVNSPHRYLSPDFPVRDGAVIVDAGAGEGNFSLSVIEKARKLYLFEADKEWIEALNATFQPWKNKVVIVNKYVSNIDTDTHVSLDSFFKGEKIDLLKADVEGCELQLLQGASNILFSQKDIMVAMCAYHRQNDAEMINRVLTQYGFDTKFSKGYMFFFLDSPPAPPYLRKGIVRAAGRIPDYNMDHKL
jgi:hypothetical protein